MRPLHIGSMVTRCLSKLMCIIGLHLVTYLRSELLLLDSSASSLQFLLLPSHFLPLASYAAAVASLPHPFWRLLPVLLWPGDIILLLMTIVMVVAICSLVDCSSASPSSRITLPSQCHSPSTCHPCFFSLVFLLVLLMSSVGVCLMRFWLH